MKRRDLNTVQLPLHHPLLSQLSITITITIKNPFHLPISSLTPRNFHQLPRTRDLLILQIPPINIPPSPPPPPVTPLLQIHRQRLTLPTASHPAILVPPRPAILVPTPLVIGPHPAAGSLHHKVLGRDIPHRLSHIDHLHRHGLALHAPCSRPRQREALAAVGVGEADGKAVRSVGVDDERGVAVAEEGGAVFFTAGFGGLAGLERQRSVVDVAGDGDAGDGLEEVGRPCARGLAAVPAGVGLACAGGCGGGGGGGGEEGGEEED